MAISEDDDDDQEWCMIVRIRYDDDDDDDDDDNDDGNGVGDDDDDGDGDGDGDDDDDDNDNSIFQNHWLTDSKAATKTTTRGTIYGSIPLLWKARSRPPPEPAWPAVPANHYHWLLSGKISPPATVDTATESTEKPTTTENAFASVAHKAAVAAYGMQSTRQVGDRAQMLHQVTYRNNNIT